MKLDLPRPSQGLTFEVLQRFAETIKAPFRRAFSCGRVDLLPAPMAGVTPIEKGGQLLVPLMYQGKVLALAVPRGVDPKGVSKDQEPLITALAEAAIEMARLRLAAETDEVTSLANEPALEEALTSALARLAPAPAREGRSMDRVAEQPGLALLAVQPRGMNALLDQHGRRFADRLLKAMARRILETSQEALCVARVGWVFLVLLEGGAGSAGRLAAQLEPALEALDVKTSDGRTWPVKVVMGAATAESMAAAGQMATEAAAIFKARALRALARAKLVGGEGLLLFGEIVEKSGRLKDILPLDKVVIDLGRVHGLSEGERFGVVVGDESQLKAEVVVVRMDEEESVAELTAISDPTNPPRPGDPLVRMSGEAALAAETEQELVVEVAGRAVRVVPDQVTGLACHRSFTKLLAELAAADIPFTAGLVRADGLEGMREALGRVAVDSLMRTLALAAAEALGEGALLGRHSPDTLAFLAPGLDIGQGEEICRALAEQMRSQTDRTVSAGLSVHPQSGFEASEALDNAAKALVHAGFFGPDSVVVFDAVSLNISGDALFNRGRMDQALAEYERALLIDPAETNVLNSLGVCHGHLGRMDKAVEYFQQAQETAPQDFMAYYNLGYAYLAQGKTQQAGGQLGRALERNPEHADTLFQLGRLAQGEGRAAAALEYFLAARAQPDCRSAVHRHLGEALASSGKMAEAEDAFKRAIKAMPKDAAALAGLAGLYVERGANLEIALSMARQAMKLEPATARHARIAGRALAGLEKFDEAAELLLGSLAEHSADPFLLAQLGVVEMARGELPAAKDLFLQALAIEPNLAEAKAALAELEEQPAHPEP